jgi:hypothetical protein
MIPLTLKQIADIVGGTTFGDESQIINSAPVFDSPLKVHSFWHLLGKILMVTISLMMRYHMAQQD